MPKFPNENKINQGFKNKKSSSKYWFHWVKTRGFPRIILMALITSRQVANSSKQRICKGFATDYTDLHRLFAIDSSGHEWH